MPDYKGLTIRFEGDASGLISTLQQIDSATERTTSTLSRINSALKLNPNNQKLYALQTQELGRLVTSQEKRVSGLNKTVKENERAYSRSNKELEKREKWLNRLHRIEGYYEKDPSMWKDMFPSQKALADAVADAQKAYDDALASVQENSSALEENQVNAELAKVKLEELKNAQRDSQIVQDFQTSKLGKTSIALGQYADGLDLIGDKLLKIGGVLTVGGIAGMLSIGRSVLSETEEYGNAISKVGGYLDITGAELEHMSELALQFGKDTRYSAVEAADAISELAKGGMTQAQIEGGALDATLQLASAGNLSLADAAETAVQAINVFGLNAADASQVADALAGAANRSTAEVNTLAQSFRYVSGWAGLADYPIQDVTGALGLLADRGLQAEVAGTGLRNVMQRIGAPTDKAKKLLEKYGFEAYNAEGKMKPLVELVQELNDSFGELGDQERNEVLNSIFGARGLPAAIALMDAGTQELEDYIDATKRVGYAEEMAQAQMGEIGWALEYLRGEFETFQVNLGTAFTPIIKETAENLENLLAAFNNMPKDEQAEWAKTIVDIATTGPKLLAVGTAFKVFASATRGLSTVTRFLGFLGSIKKDAGGAALTMSNFGEAIAKTSEGAVTASTATSLLTSGFKLLGIAAAAYVAIRVWQDYKKAEEHARDYNRVLSRMGYHASAAYSDMSTLGGTIAEVGEEAHDTAADTEELIDSLNRFYDEMDEGNRQVEVDVGRLNSAFDTIRQLGGQENLSTEQLAELSGALHTVNDELGTSYSLHSDSGGVIYDENDAVVTLTSSIGALIEAKKAEIRAEATGNQLKRAYEEQADAKQKVADAQKEVNRQEELFYDILGGKAGYVDGELISLETVNAAKRSLEEQQTLLSGIDDTVDSLEQDYGEATLAAQQAAEATRNALAENVDTIDGLAEAIKDNKLSIADFTGFTIDDFNKMQEDCGDDVQKMIDWLIKWRDTEAKDKQVKVTADTFDAEQKIRTIKSLMAELKDKDVAVRYRTVYTRETKAAGGIRTHAEGGIAAYAGTPRYHAGGSIVNVPNTGYPLDWVGEAGAEAIVPLTNRRYSQPFVDLIADGVSRRMGAGTSYNLYINGARVNDDPQIRGQFIDLMTTLARKGAMNDGAY